MACALHHRFFATVMTLAACGPASPEAEAVHIATAPLSASTASGLFAMGRDRTFQPWVGYGALAHSPSTASLSFRHVPEGSFDAEFIGYGTLVFAAPNPASFPATGLCMTEQGRAPLEVTSGLRRVTTITPAPQACARVAVDRPVALADYTPDPTLQWNGAPGGRNVITLLLDGWSAAPVEVRLETRPGSLGLGLFAGLPTPPAVLWPAWPSWSQTLTLLPDANGDARCAVVARPGADPSTWEVTVSQGANRVPLRVLVQGPAPLRGCAPVCDDGVSCTVDTCNTTLEVCEATPDDAACDDANACTADRCDAATGCAHTAVADGTTCATGVCLAGACIGGTRLEAIEPTGWASTEGSFNTNHSELRCGDDGRGGATPYEMFPGLTFDLSALPPGATVTRARLNVHHVRVDGDAPYGPALHEVVAEHVQYTNMWEADEVMPVTGTIGQRLLSTSGTVGWRVADITEAVIFERAASRTRVQVRLRFTPQMTDGDTAIDWAVFTSNNALAPADVLRPFLEVWYVP